MIRYKVEKEDDHYIIIDTFKKLTCLRDTRYIAKTFVTEEQAYGYIFGKGKITRDQLVSINTASIKYKNSSPRISKDLGDLFKTLKEMLKVEEDK